MSACWRGPLVACLAVAGLLGADPVASAGSTLEIRAPDGWREWWRAERAPDRWTGPDTLLSRALVWKRLGDGVSWASAQIAARPLWITQLVVVRIDPRRVRFTLELALSPEDGRPAWTIDRAPSDAVVAVNAGQFLMTMPWGWLVTEGRERLAPGVGPLSLALAVDSAGAVRWIAGDSLSGARPRVVTAFQSYPTLLAQDGRIPEALREPGRGVDLAHRDARVAIGETRDGSLLILMTRFAALGEFAERIPIGPTTPETAAIMGALGAHTAVMLDGGISSQMVLHDPASGRHWRWEGMRKVPLALIVRPRRR